MLEAGNVSKLHPEKEEEIAALMPKSSWVDFNKITAYKIEKGHIISILDKEYNIIVADQIDSTSDEQEGFFFIIRFRIIWQYSNKPAHGK